MSLSISPSIITENMTLYIDPANVSCYPTTGTTCTDLSTTKTLSMGLVNTPTFSSSNRGIFTFDGTNEYLTSDIYYTMTSGMTWDIWFNRTLSMGTNNTLFSNSRPYISFRGTTSKILVGYFTRKAGVNTSRSLSTNQVLSNNVWYHVTMTMLQDPVGGTSTVEIYINGVLDTSQTFTSAVDEVSLPTGTTRLLIGTLVEAGQTYWNGSIGSFKLYNRILNSGEILKNFNSMKGRYFL